MIEEENEYNFKAEWSDRDNCFIGRCKEFSWLAAHGDTEEEALKEIQFVVEIVVEELQKEAESAKVEDE